MYKPCRGDLIPTIIRNTYMPNKSPFRKIKTMTNQFPFLDSSIHEAIYEKFGIEINEVKAPIAREQILLLGTLALTLQSNQVTLMQRLVRLNIADRDYQDHLTLLNLIDDRIQKLLISLDPIKRHFSAYGYSTDHPIPLAP